MTMTLAEMTPYYEEAKKCPHVSNPFGHSAALVHAYEMAKKFPGSDYTWHRSAEYECETWGHLWMPKPA